jgi:hypothetical protein
LDLVYFECLAWVEPELLLQQLLLLRLLLYALPLPHWVVLRKRLLLPHQAE